MPQDPRPFYGWTVVAAVFVVATFGWGIGFYGPAVYLEATRAARGWSVALVSGAVTLHFLAGAAVTANLPRLHRRFGLPAVTLASAVLLAIGVLGWSMALAPWQLYAAALVSGAGWVGLGAAAVNAMIAPWFVAGRPRALSLAYNGASVGGVIFAPLWSVLIAGIGFPLAAAAIGAGMGAVIAALALTVLARTPAGMNQAPDGGEAAPGARAATSPVAIADPWRDPSFQTLAAGMALALFAQIGLIAHLVSLLSPALGPQGAGLAAGLCTLAAILGRTVVGWLMPAGADRRGLAAGSLLVQAAGCGAMIAAGGDPRLLVAGIVLIGLGIGNATSLPPLIAQVEFAREDVARVVALIVAAAQAAYAFAPALFGLVREIAPEGAPYALAAAVQGLAIAAYWAGRGLHRRRIAPRGGPA